MPVMEAVSPKLGLMPNSKVSSWSQYVMCSCVWDRLTNEGLSVVGLDVLDGDLAGDRVLAVSA